MVLLPGLDGTGSLFADFATALKPEVEAIVVAYRNDVGFGYIELEAAARARGASRSQRIAG